LCAAALSAALVMATPAVAEVTRDDRRRARAAARYLVEQQRDSGAIVAFSKIGSTADAVLALVAARRGPKTIDRGIGFLKRHERGVDTVGETAKVYMALVAAGEQPRLGERDLRAELEASQQSDGAYGDNSNNDQVISHALAMLALASDGQAANGEAVTFLLEAQCGNGGWQYDAPSTEADDPNCQQGDTDFSAADSNTTSYAVMALEATQGNRTPDADPFAFFGSVRDEVKGGWFYTSVFPSVTDANSTSLVIQAHVAAGRAIPDGGEVALLKLQYGRCSKGRSAFAYSWTDENEDGRYTKRERTGPDVGATSAAIPAVLEKPLPLAPAEVARRAPRPRCGSGA